MRSQFGVQTSTQATEGVSIITLDVEDCYEDAVLESFFSNLWTECATDVYNTRAKARESKFEYVEM